MDKRELLNIKRKLIIYKILKYMSVLSCTVGLCLSFTSIVSYLLIKIAPFSFKETAAYAAIGTISYSVLVHSVDKIDILENKIDSFNDKKL